MYDIQNSKLGELSPKRFTLALAYILVKGYMKSYNFQLKFICISPWDLSKEMYFSLNQKNPLIFKNHPVFEMEKSYEMDLFYRWGKWDLLYPKSYS